MRSLSIIKPTLLLLALLTVVITGCATNSAAGQSSGTATASPTTTPIIVNGVRYQRVTDKMFGFQLDIPAEVTHIESNTVSQTNGDYNLWDTVSGLGITFGGATTGIYPNQCPQAIPDAKAVIVGSGITGYQQDTLSPPGPHPSGSVPSPSISVTFLSDGNLISFTLADTGQRNTFLQRNGAIWAHMLASFTPGSYVNPHPVCS